MALVTFTPIVRPSPGAAHAQKVSLLRSDFGDGYTQSSPNGINHIRKSITLKWNGLGEDDVASLDAFFVSQGGNKAFYYTPYGMTEAMKWTCEEWSASSGAPWTFTAKLEQSFSLEV